MFGFSVIALLNIYFVRMTPRERDNHENGRERLCITRSSVFVLVWRNRSPVVRAWPSFLSRSLPRHPARQRPSSASRMVRKHSQWCCVATTQGLVISSTTSSCCLPPYPLTPFLTLFSASVIIIWWAGIVESVSRNETEGSALDIGQRCLRCPSPQTDRQ